MHRTKNKKRFESGKGQKTIFVKTVRLKLAGIEPSLIKYEIQSEVGLVLSIAVSPDITQFNKHTIVGYTYT